MGPAEFVAAWGQPLVRPAPAALAGASLPASSVAFLGEAGLPGAAAPGFRFDFPEGRILRVAELPEPPRGLGEAERARYLWIGRSHRTLVCLDPQDGRVVQILEGTDDRPAIVKRVNSSVAQLAESLFVFREVMEEAVAAEAVASRAAIESASRRAALPPAQQAQFYQRLSENRDALQQALKQEEDRARERFALLADELARIDPPAMEDDTFWETALRRR